MSRNIQRLPRRPSSATSEQLAKESLNVCIADVLSSGDDATPRDPEPEIETVRAAKQPPTLQGSFETSGRDSLPFLRNSPGTVQITSHSYDDIFTMETKNRAAKIRRLERIGAGGGRAGAAPRSPQGRNRVNVTAADHAGDTGTSQNRAALTPTRDLHGSTRTVPANSRNNLEISKLTDATPQSELSQKVGPDRIPDEVQTARSIGSSSTSSENVDPREYEIRKLKETLAQYQKRILVLTDQCEEGRRRMNLAESDNEQLHRRLASTELENVTLQQANRRSDSRLRDNSDEISHYELRIRLLEGELKDSQEEKRRFIEELESVRAKLQDRDYSSHTSHDLLNSEVRKRDETITKLRQDINKIQESRDQAATEVDRTQIKLSNLENVVRKRSDELAAAEQQCHMQEQATMELRRELSAAQDELHARASRSARNKDEMEHLRQQQTAALEQVQRLTEALQKVQATSKESREALAAEVANRHDTVEKLKTEARELEEKYREALQTIQHRSDVIKQLRDDIKTSSARLSEANDRCKRLDRELAESQRKLADQTRQIDRFESRVNGMTLMVAQQDTMHKTEMTESQGACNRLVTDTDLLNERLAQAAQQINSKDVCLDRLQSQLHELSEALGARQLVIRQLEARLFDNEETWRRTEVEAATRADYLARLEADFADLQAQYRTAIEDNGRLEARACMAATDAQSEQDLLAEEVKRREDNVQRLRLDLVELRDELRRVEARSSTAERSLEQSQRHLASVRSDLERRTEELTRCQAELERSMGEANREKENAAKLGERVRELESELRSSRREVDQAVAACDGKEKAVFQLKMECQGLQDQSYQLFEKIGQRDELLQKLSTETNKLKHKYQDKLTEAQVQAETIHRMQEAISKAQADQENTRRRCGDELTAKEKAGRQLQSDLIEANSQYARCYEELMRLDNELTRTKAAMEERGLQLMQAEAECSRLREAQEQLELDLAVSQEKHRTCQAEVAARDAAVLQGRAELDTVRQELLGVADEVEFREEESRRWQAKIKELQNETRRMENSVEEKEFRISSQEQTINQLQNQLQLALQECRNHICSIDHLKSEHNLERAAHEEKLAQLQQQEMLTHQELEDCRQAEEAIRTQATAYKTNADLSRLELEQTRQELRTARDENKRAMERINLRTDEAEKRRIENRTLQAQLEESKKKSDKLDHDLTSAQEKQGLAFRQISGLQDTIRQMEDRLTQQQKREQEALECMDKTKSDRENILRQLEDRRRQVSQCEDCIRQLNEEMRRGQDELSRATERAVDMEAEIVRVNEELLTISRKLKQTEERSRQLESELSAFKENHVWDNNQVDDLHNRLQALSNEVQQLNCKLSACDETNQELQETAQDLQNELISVEEQRSAALKEAARYKAGIQQTREQLGVEQQRYRAEVAVWEERGLRLETEIRDLRKVAQGGREEAQTCRAQAEKAEKEVEQAREAARGRETTIEKLEATIRDLRVEMTGVERQRGTLEEERRKRSDELERSLTELADTRTQYRDCAQELARHEEKIAVLEQTLLATQEQLTTRVQELGKFESAARRQANESRHLEERCNQAEAELTEARQTIDKLRREFGRVKEEAQAATQESVNSRQEVGKLQVELDGHREHRQMLANQVEQQEQLIGQLQHEIKLDRHRVNEMSKQATANKRLITELQEENANLTTLRTDLHVRIEEREAALSARQEQVDELSSCVRDLREQMAEREGQIRAVLAEMEAAQRIADTASGEANHYHEAVNAMQTELEDRTQLVRRLQEELRDRDSRLGEGRTQLATAQSAQGELVAQLADKAKELLATKSEISRLQGLTEQLSDTVSNREETVRRSKTEVQRTTEERNQLEETVGELRTRLREAELLSTDHQRRNQKLTRSSVTKEEELTAARTELAASQKRTSAQAEELNSLHGQVAALQKESHDLRLSLEESRLQSDQLHRDSESVVANVNAWVQEQKSANEKLGDKIRDQSRAIQRLEQEKQRVVEHNRDLMDQLRRLKSEMGGNLIDTEKFKTLQLHSDQQQTVLNQLKSKLEHYENEFGGELEEKNSLLENAQSRLKSQLESVARLNQQLSALQLENRRLRGEAERAELAVQSYRIQVESKEQTVNSLKAQLEAKSFQSLFHDNQTVHSISDKPVRDNGNVRDASQLDKAYWIKRVGELSLQLQHSSEYWAEKIRDLSAQMESVRHPSRATTPHLLSPSPNLISPPILPPGSACANSGPLVANGHTGERV